MTRDDIIKQLNAEIAERFEISEGNIQHDAIIQHTLNLNSLSALEMIVLIKKKLNVMITTRELPQIVTFDDLYDYIFYKLSN